MELYFSVIGKKYKLLTQFKGLICRPRGFMRCSRGTLRRCRSLHDDRPWLSYNLRRRRRVIRPRRPRAVNRFIISVTHTKAVNCLSLSHITCLCPIGAK